MHKIQGFVLMLQRLRPNQPRVAIALTDEHKTQIYFTMN